MKSILNMAVTLFVLATTINNLALAKDNHEEESHIQQFIGLWEGIDPNDGSSQILSITDNGDGKVKLLLHDTFLTQCGGGRGLAQGTGEIGGRHTLRSEDYALTCFEEATPPDFPPITLILNRDNTLFREETGPLPSVTYHQTSKSR